MKNNKGNKIGMLQPMQKHRFRVMINNDVDLAAQVVKCSFNFIKKEFELIVRQPITSGIIEKINCIGIGRSTINIAATDLQNDKDYFCYELLGAEVIDHNFELDYGSGDIATHTLMFKYQSLKVE